MQTGKPRGVGPSRSEAQMASVLGDEIDILAKAKRALDADYTPGDDEEYMSPQ